MLNSMTSGRVGRLIAVLAMLAFAAQDPAFARGNGTAGAAGPGTSGGAAGHGDNVTRDPKVPADPNKGSESNAGCAAVDLPDPTGYADVAASLKALSEATKTNIDRCRCATQACIADVLDRYAEKLAVIRPKLAPALRELPTQVSSAARRIRAAKTKTEAVKILHATVAHINNEIELLRADKSETIREQTRGGEAVAGALEYAAIKLERADGL